jgi:hypothetical protein
MTYYSAQFNKYNSQVSFITLTDSFNLKMYNLDFLENMFHRYGNLRKRWLKK